MYAFSEKLQILFKILLKLNCNRCFYSSSLADCILFGHFGLRCRELSHLMNVSAIFFGQFHQKLRHRFNIGWRCNIWWLMIWQIDYHVELFLQKLNRISSFANFFSSIGTSVSKFASVVWLLDLPRLGRFLLSCVYPDRVRFKSGLVA